MTDERRLFHQNAFGHAWQCRCGDAVHIQFGNVALLLSHSQLREFTSYIGDTVGEESSVGDRYSRNIYIPTRDLALMFVMTYTELRMLDEILNQTLIAIEIDKMLSN
jgi:hypothetical protein